MSNRDKAAEVIRKAYREAFFRLENQIDWAPFAADALSAEGLLAPEDNDEVVRLRQALEERIRVWLIVADKLDNRGLAAEADVTRIHANELTRILIGDANE